MHNRALRCGGLAGLLVLFAGCAASSDGGLRANSLSGQGGQGGQRVDAKNSDYSAGLDGRVGVDALEMLAQREAEAPSVPAVELVQRILGQQFVLADEGTDAYERAVMATADVLRDAVDAMGFEGEADGQVDGDLVPLIPQLAKGYVRARAAMLDKDYAQAVAIYEQLAQASPNSTEILVGLGDALMGKGDRAQGAAVYLDAVERGDRTMRAMVMGAIGLQGRGQAEDRDRMLGLASLAWMDEMNTDRAGRVLGGVVLGQALLEDGYYNAGAEVLESALSMLDGQVVRDARYRREMVQLYSKRADRMAAAGDAWLLLGEADRAERMYGLAGEMVTAEPVGLLSRRVATKLLAGESGRGALMLLEWLDANPGNESRSLGVLASAVADHPLAGGYFAQAVDSMIGDGQRTASSRRALVGVRFDIEEANYGDDWAGGFGVEMLASADAVLVTPVLGSRVLGGIDDDSERLEAVLMVVDRNPAAAVALAQALVRVDGRPVELMERIAEAGGRGKSESADLLRCLVALDLQRPDLLGLEGLQIDEGASTTWLIAHGRAAALGARWALSSELFELVGGRAGDRFDQMSVTEWAFYCDSLVAANRMSDAIAAVEARVDLEGTSAAEWVVAARVSQKVGAPEAMVGSLQRALELDAYDEAIYEQLIALYSSTNSGDGAESSDNAEGLRNLTRLLAQRLPDSALVKLIRANEMAGASLRGSDGGVAAGQGSALLQQSERLLLELAEEYPWREIGVDLLLSIWATEAAQGDPTGAQRGLAMTAFRMESLPGSVELASARARLMVLTGDEVGAEGYLDSLYERMPSRQVGRLHEGLIRSEEGRRSEADALSIDRLEGLVSVGDGLERMERSVVVGPLTAVRFKDFDADELIPAAGPDVGAQGGEWMYGSGQALRVVRVLASVVQGNTDQATNDLVLELIKRARGRVEIGQVLQEIDVVNAFDQIELLALPNSSGYSIDAYERLVRALVEVQEDDSMIGIAVQSLMRARDTSAGMELLTRLTIQNDGAIDDQRIVELSSLLAQGGTSEDVERSVGYLESKGYLVEARNAVTEGFGTLSEEYRSEDENTDSVRADWIYSVAVVASFYERDSVAEEMYRLALSSDPEHAWANNDFGYKMVEDGRDLVEAERMLRVAHAREPGAASITDSLGWALYAIGQLNDELDETGQVVSQGAKTLLEEAIGIDPENATIHDHLGDVLWLLGAYESAVESWLEAEEVLRGRLTELSTQEIANPRAVEMMRDELSKVRQKISDAESGRVPGVAPSQWDAPVGVWDDTVEP